jgi:hypothetical protein
VAFKKYGDAVISQPVTAQVSKKTASVGDAVPAMVADVEALLDEASKSPDSWVVYNYAVAPATPVKK